MPLFRTLLDRFVVRATRSDVYESRYLREYFDRVYGIKVGLYSGGYFDRWRIPPGTVVGRYSTIASTVRVIDSNHPTGSLSTHPYFYLKQFGFIETDLNDPRPPVIEDDVWMGHYAIVAPGCKRVGRGSIIGAGSVVARDVPRYAIMMGSPAQLIRYRFTPDVIDAIEATEWWLLDRQQLAQGLRVAKDFLNSPSVESARAFMRGIGRSDARIPSSSRASSSRASVAAATPTATASASRDGKMSDQAVLELIKTEIPSFSPGKVGSSFEELGLDSLGFVLLRATFERVLGHPISDQEWGHISTPADLIALLSGTISAPAAPNAQTAPDAELAIPASGSATNLYWLPKRDDWNSCISELEASGNVEEFRAQLTALANYELDTSQTARLDRLFARSVDEGQGEDRTLRPIRLAVIGSCTLTHLLPAIRIAALRRGLHVTIYEGSYGQYFQELSDSDSEFYAFGPDVVLLAIDAVHLTRGIDTATDAQGADTALQAIVLHLKQCWRIARERKIALIQQTPLPLFRPLLGNNEQRLPGSKEHFIARLNRQLRELSEAEGIDLLSIDSKVAAHGLDAWHDPVYWHRAKQEIKPAAAPLYGDLLARLLAARQGLSYKCLVLDLDNTLWGGVIGDDGLDGIVLGQGSGQGEAFLDVQNYASELAKRGVILAVCSKNDESNAREAFERHPEMVLKLGDVSCFVANWEDKAKNIRRIAQELNIGLESLVFMDDNPFERSLVRSELPMVAVPELPQEPALYARTLSDAGYFESIAVTREDRERTRQYRANVERSAFEVEAADMPTYLRNLDMKLMWSEFDAVGLQRVVQLINKTNQFNLTTKRYSEEDVRAVMADPQSFGLQFRLLDRFGDNGIISIVIAKRRKDAVLIDTWLMSCRVLGRQVEEAVLNVIASKAKSMGADALVGAYYPTAKNGIVRAHYPKLGFSEDGEHETHTSWRLELRDMSLRQTFIRLDPGVDEEMFEREMGFAAR